MTETLAFFYIDPLYFLYVGPFILLAMWASWRVKATFAEHNRGQLRSGISGAGAARAILDAAGLSGVGIKEVPGMLSDHYNPIDRSVNLSGEILRGRTPAAVAVAAHECGHAIQHAKAWSFFRLRSAMVPAVQVTSTLATPMIFFGFMLLVLARSPMGSFLALLGVVAFALVVVFHFVTLPVEFDASRRAIRILEVSGIVAADEMDGVRKPLFAAGFTYVAAALMALAQLVYWLVRLGILGGGDD